MSSDDSKSEVERKSVESTAPRRCLVCMEEQNLKECSRCHAAYYCSAAHQKEHWKTHKTVCKSINIPVPRNIPKAPKASPSSTDETPSAHTYLGRCDGSGIYVLWGFFYTGANCMIANMCIQLGDGEGKGIQSGMCAYGARQPEELEFVNKLMPPDTFGAGDSRDEFGRRGKRQACVPISVQLAKRLAKRALSDTHPEVPTSAKAPLPLFLALPGDEVEVSEEESQFRTFVERSPESEAMSPGPLGGEGRFSEIVYVFQCIRGEYSWAYGLREDMSIILGPPPHKGMPRVPNANSDAAAHAAFFKWSMDKVSSVRSVYERQEKTCRHMALWHYLMKEPRCAALLWHCAEGMTSDCYMSPWLRAQVLRTQLDVRGEKYFFNGPFSPVAGVIERLQRDVEELFGYEEHTV